MHGGQSFPESSQLGISALPRALLNAYPNLNDTQREIAAHQDSPLLVFAGPGSRKTFSMVLRTMNILLLERALPKELIVCTFTGKAAYELRDRIAAAAGKVGYKKDLSEMRVSTIHGMCNRIVTAYRHHLPIGNNYETLDELTQLLFLFDHFEVIAGKEVNGHFLDKWSTKWTAIEGMQGTSTRLQKNWLNHRNWTPLLIRLFKLLAKRTSATVWPYSRTTGWISPINRSWCMSCSRIPDTRLH